MDTKTTTNEALALVTMMVLALVDHPGEIKIHADAPTPEQITTIHVKSSPLDTGKLVGKQGRTARSMRTILSGHSMRTKHRFLLNIVETERPQDAPGRASDHRTAQAPPRTQQSPGASLRGYSASD